MNHLIYVHLCKQATDNITFEFFPDHILYRQNINFNSNFVLSEKPHPFKLFWYPRFTLRNKYDVPEIHYCHLSLEIELQDTITDAHYPKNEVDKTQKSR